VAGVAVPLVAYSHRPEFTSGSLDPGVTIIETKDVIVLLKGSPVSTTAGFRFYPRGLVGSPSYLSLLADLAATGIPLVVAKGWGPWQSFLRTRASSWRAPVRARDQQGYRWRPTRAQSAPRGF